MIKLRPCDCKDQATSCLLNEQGIKFNNNSIVVEPSVVVLQLENTTIRLPMSLFKSFAEWYLEEQEVDVKANIKRNEINNNYFNGPNTYTR